MTKRILLLAAPLALVAACGGSDDPTVFTVSSGSYNVSSGTATAAFPNDACRMAPLFQVGELPIDLIVNGTTANFDFVGDSAVLNRLTTAAINGNLIEHATDAFYDRFDNTPNPSGCVWTTRLQVNGEITANNSMRLIAKYTKAAKAGNTFCNATVIDTIIDAASLPCTSEIDFLATKVP
jgi:hypothetical protein